MIFKINRDIITLAIFFIAFHQPIEFIQGKLPNADLLAAIPCLREFFGDDFVQVPFLRENDVLLNGEYLGGFCEKVSSNCIDDKVQQDTQGSRIKICLIKSKHQKVFKKFSHQSGSVNHTICGIIPETSGLSKLLPRIVRNAPPQNETLPNTPIMKFIAGICKSEEYVEYDTLKKIAEKLETQICLFKCAENFMNRIKRKLIEVKSNIINFLQKKLHAVTSVMEEKNVSHVEDTTNQLPSNDSLLKEKYTVSISCLEINQFIDESTMETYTETVRRHSSSSIEALTSIGKLYFEKYAEFYYEKDICLAQDIEGLPNFSENLDSNLFKIFSLYKHCSKLGCGMGPASTPLYDFIETEAKKSKLDKDTSTTTTKHLATHNANSKSKNFFSALFGDLSNARNDP